MAVRQGIQRTNEARQSFTTWLGLANGDSGSPAMPFGSDLTAQVYGTFGVGGSVLLEGSPDGGVTWGTLHDVNDALIAITNNEPVVIKDNTLLVRPRVTAGDGTTSLNVVIAAAIPR